MVDKYDTLKIEIRDGAMLIELARPQSRHSLNEHLVRDLAAAIRAVAEDCTAVILTASGPVFCSGADLSAFPPIEIKDCENSSEAAQKISSLVDDRYNDVIRAMRSCRRPVIAALNGHAVGGGVGLALSADALLMAHGATIQLPFVPKLGLVPDMGAMWFLARATGAAAAARLCLTGAKVDAVEASRLGIAWAHHEQSELLAAAFSLAEQLAGIETALLQAFRDQTAGVLDRTLDEQLRLEAAQQGALAAQPRFLDRIADFRRTAA